MECLKPLSDFFKSIEADPRISTTHISIYAALLQCWKENNYINPLKAYRNEIMRVAKISASTTYHKRIKELDEYGYIKYEPSYKRNQASKVFIVLKQGSEKEI